VADARPGGRSAGQDIRAGGRQHRGVGSGECSCEGHCCCADADTLQLSTSRWTVKEIKKKTFDRCNNTSYFPFPHLMVTILLCSLCYCFLLVSKGRVVSSGVKCTLVA
jgi:hypothetical protein